MVRMGAKTDGMINSAAQRTGDPPRDVRSWRKANVRYSAATSAFRAQSSNENAAHTASARFASMKARSTALIRLW